MLIFPFSNPLIVEFTCKVYILTGILIHIGNFSTKKKQPKKLDVNSPVNKNN